MANYLKEKYIYYRNCFYIHSFGAIIQLVSMPILNYYGLYIASAMMAPWVILNTFLALHHRGLKNSYNLELSKICT